jgi:hypothetical protein
MPTYFGLPLNLNEIIRILNLSTLMDNTFESFTRQIYDYEIYNKIRKHIKSSTNLDLFISVKGQFIL